MGGNRATTYQKSQKSKEGNYRQNIPEPEPSEEKKLEYDEITKREVKEKSKKRIPTPLDKRACEIKPFDGLFKTVDNTYKPKRKVLVNFIGSKSPQVSI